jgi:hypothetical protein
MKNFLPATLGILFLISCKGKKEEPAGGPCSYKEEIHPAKLIELRHIDSLSFDAAFEIGSRRQGGNSTDTEYFHSLNRQYITAEQVKRDSIMPGKLYQLVESNIISGSCNPHILSIRMQPFTNQ